MFIFLFGYVIILFVAYIWLPVQIISGRMRDSSSYQLRASVMQEIKNTISENATPPLITLVKFHFNKIVCVGLTKLTELLRNILGLEFEPCTSQLLV